jgi:C-terminal processing protease CtpA/Prc
MPPIWLQVLAISIGLSFVSVSQAWITTASNKNRKLLTSTSLRLSTNDPDEKVADDPQKDDGTMLVVAEQLRRKAEQLRNEVNQFEKAKQAGQREQLAQEEQVRTEREQRRDRYSCIVPILKPDGSTVMERCDFPPRYYDTNNNSSSFITTVEASLPLGILLGENNDGSISIDEVAESGNGATAGLRITDLVRAITACRVEMAFPTWQLLAGGIGRPKTVRFMYSVDNRPLDEVMAEVASNRLDPENRPVLVVIERRMVE